MKRGTRIRLFAPLLAAALTLGEARASYSPGGLILIEEIVASNQATVDFTNGITTAYQSYLIEYWGVKPATDDSWLAMRVSTDGGGSWITGTTYDYAVEVAHVDVADEADLKASGSAQNRGALMLTAAGYGAGSAAGEDAWGVITIVDPTNGALHKRWRAYGGYVDAAGRLRAVDAMGTRVGVVAVNGFRLLFDSGNIASGTFRLYAQP